MSKVDLSYVKSDTARKKIENRAVVLSVVVGERNSRAANRRLLRADRGRQPDQEGTCEARRNERCLTAPLHSNDNPHNRVCPVALS
jgi:hypothetical protein